MHCAASSNNLELMRILVENGASILPMTISDRESPVQKCSRNLPGCEEAVRYLTGQGLCFLLKKGRLLVECMRRKSKYIKAVNNKELFLHATYVLTVCITS